MRLSRKITQLKNLCLFCYQFLVFTAIKMIPFKFFLVNIEQLNEDSQLIQILLNYKDESDLIRIITMFDLLDMFIIKRLKLRLRIIVNNFNLFLPNFFFLLFIILVIIFFFE